jgi:hypothetical protein
MDWISVGRAIAPLAPTLGGVLGGLIPFPGAALAGQAIGNVIARQLGVEPTPQAVSDALAKMSHEQKMHELTQATERARIEVNGFVEAEKAYQETIRVAVGETGQTMRLELLAETRHWFYTGWRPAAGWIFDFYMAIFGGLLVVATFLAFGGNKVPLETMTNAWPIYAAFSGILAAMVGVYVIGRSNEKSKAIEAAPPVKKAGK